MRKLHIFIVATLLLPSLISCGGSRENEPVAATENTLQATLEATITTVVIPAVERFADESQALTTHAQNFCDLPTTASLANLQQQWKTATEAWYRLLPYNFGPLNDDPVFPTYIYIDALRLRGTDYTTTLREDISRNLAESFALNTEFFDNQPFQKVGLQALEILIFESADNHSTESEKQLDDYRQHPRKCELLLGLSKQLTQHATRVALAWTRQYRSDNRSYKSLFISNELPDGTPAISLLLTSAQHYLDYLQQRDVANIAAPLSAHTWVLLSHTTTAIETLLTGTGHTRFTFFSLMSAANHSSDVATVTDTIAFMREAVEYQNAADFGVAAALLDGNFKREIPNSLEIDLGITFSDGD